MSPLSALKFAMLGAALLALPACQDSEARAEAHYRSALELLEAGDTVRAALEFRNVFQLDGTHLEARRAYAAMLRATGDVEQAYRQYLRLVEQDPENLEARIALTEMALEFQNWEEVRWHGERALALAPDAPETGVIALNLDYLAAVEAEDAPARREIAAAAVARLESEPDNFLLQRLAIDTLMRDRAFDAALEIVEAGLAADPERRVLHDLRLQILATLERPEEIEAQLQEMLRRFPGDRDLQGMLLRFYMSRNDIAGARGFLDTIAETTDQPELREEALAALVQLTLEHDGPEAAMTEIDRIIEAQAGDVAAFRALRAGLRYRTGDRAGGVADLEALLEEELSQIQRGRFRVMLAQMLLEDGNPVGAQRLVEEVLEADPNQTEALKMRAAWLIEDDETDRAIQHLRTALDDSPEDAQALTLMASAYARAGNRDLAREFLALAMQASGGAPTETARYVRVLIEDERHLLAEEALIAALRLSPDHPELLRLLGEVYLRIEDWPRAEHVERTLRGLGPEQTAAADRMRAAILAGQGQTAQALAFLEGVAQAAGDGDVQAQAAVIRARLVTGDVAGALSYAEDLVAREPGNVSFRAILASVQSATGRFAEAAAGFRALAGENPQMQQAWIGLVRALSAQDLRDEARAALEEALTALPEAPDLLWAEASFREREGDIDGAIAIYEDLYAVASDSPVVANNLASLISTHREDPESLERAYLIARRLQGLDVPAFQDTYGWIAYRRGEYAEALAHLEPAAAALVEDALVQFHLGMTYLALERRPEALAQLTRAVEMAGPEDSRPQFARARDEIAALEAAGVTPAGE